MAIYKNIEFKSSDVEEMLKYYVRFSEKSLADIVRKYARICCVELAYRTQPYRKQGWENSRVIGTTRVQYDIEKVFRAQQTIERILEKTENDNLRERMQKLFSAGEYKKLGDILYMLGITRDQMEVVPFAKMPPVHKAQRHLSSGRVARRPYGFNYAPSLDRYIKAAQKRVGMSKSGWASCARAIGGIKGDGARGIPAWAKRRSHGNHGRIVDRTHDKENPTILITNQIPWLRRLMRKQEQNAARNFAYLKMIKEIVAILRYERRKRQRVKQ